MNLHRGSKNSAARRFGKPKNLKIISILCIPPNHFNSGPIFGFGNLVVHP